MSTEFEKLKIEDVLSDIRQAIRQLDFLKTLASDMSVSYFVVSEIEGALKRADRYISAQGEWLMSTDNEAFPRRIDENSCEVLMRTYGPCEGSVPASYDELLKIIKEHEGLARKDRQIVGYDLLMEVKPKELTQKVKQMLIDGWEPLGAAFSDADGILCQTVVKYED